MTIEMWLLYSRAVRALTMISICKHSDLNMLRITFRQYVSASIHFPQSLTLYFPDSCAQQLRLKLTQPSLIETPSLKHNPSWDGCSVWLVKINTFLTLCTIKTIPSQDSSSEFSLTSWSSGVSCQLPKYNCPRIACPFKAVWTNWRKPEWWRCHWHCWRWGHYFSPLKPSWRSATPPLFPKPLTV